MNSIFGRGKHWLQSRADGPVVLLCHSNSTSADLFEPLFESSLARTYRLIAPQFPGHLGGPRLGSANECSIGAMAAELAKFVQDLTDAPCAFIGHSLGGHVMSAALAHVEKLAGLMLISAPPIKPEQLQDIFKPDPTEGLLFKAELSEPEVQRFIRALVNPLRVSESMLQSLERAIRFTEPGFRVGLGASLARGELIDEARLLSRSTAPTVLVHGADDPFLKAEYIAGVHLNCPWREGLYSLEGCGHSPHWEEPRRFFELLEAFLNATFG